MIDSASCTEEQNNSRFTEAGVFISVKKWRFEINHNKCRNRKDITDMKYSLIAMEYPAELDRKTPSIQHAMITWGEPETMEALFARFGGDRNALRQKTGCIGHHYRFKYVMDRLDRESKNQMLCLKNSICITRASSIVLHAVSN